MFILALTNLIRRDANRTIIFQSVDSTLKSISHYPLDTVKPNPRVRSYIFCRLAKFGVAIGNLG